MNMTKILRGVLLISCLLILSLQTTFGQSAPAYSMRGMVKNVVTLQSIPFAEVQILKADSVKISTLTDTLGEYTLNKLNIGNYTLRISAVGYERLDVNIAISSGKQTVTDVELTPTSVQLDVVNVVASSNIKKTICAINIINLISVFSKDNFHKVPALFNDIARAVATQTGVSAENDGANHISVRGLTPNAVQWYVEGGEIVNPNHLSNAGVGNDRASQSGGGVSILSLQMFESATFYKSLLPMRYQNALGGAVDVRLRNGNNRHQETTLSTSLVGLDVATEGSFNRKDTSQNAASYIINYRYSTVGLLNKLGVKLGDEATNYQDINMNLTFPTRKYGVIKIFALGGVSDNVFLHKDRPDWLTQKDSQDITFKSKMGAVGLTHQWHLTAKSSLQTVITASGLVNSRRAIGYANQLPTKITYNENSNVKYYARSFYQRTLAQDGILQVGMAVKYESINRLDSALTVQSKTGFNDGGGSLFLMPFAGFQGKIGNNWSYLASLRAVYVGFTKQTSIEPNLKITYKTGKTGELNASYGRASQALPTIFYFTKDVLGNYLNRQNALTATDVVALSYDNNINARVNYQIEGFYQIIQHNWGSEESVIDAFEPRQQGISNDLGRAKTLGIELSIGNQYISKKSIYWWINASFYDAKLHDNTTNTDRNLRYNGRYSANALLGKEWTVGRAKNKSLGIGARILLRGGFWDSPIDVAASQKAGQTVRLQDKNHIFTTQMSDYFRTDMNIYYKNNHKKWTSTFQLDIQNVSNQQNVQYYYFDTFTQKVTPQYQLGLVPNITYKIEF